MIGAGMTALAMMIGSNETITDPIGLPFLVRVEIQL